MKKFIILTLLFCPMLVLAERGAANESCKDLEIKALKLENELQELVLAETRIRDFFNAAEEANRDIRARVSGLSSGKAVCGGDFAQILYSTTGTLEHGDEANIAIQKIKKNKEKELTEMKSLYNKRCQPEWGGNKNGVIIPHIEFPQ